MTDFHKSYNIKISREIIFFPNLKITDLISLDRIQVEQGFRSKHFPPRSVPQSLYFQKKCLSEDIVFSLNDKIGHLNEHKYLEVTVL